MPKGLAPRQALSLARVVNRFTKTRRRGAGRLLRMDSPATHSPGAAQLSAPIADLFSLTLVDGIRTQTEGRAIVYRKVRLRETSVADERTATRLAERVLLVGGVPKLLVSERDFAYAMTMLHIESLQADSGELIPAALIDLDLFGKLSSHDLGLIEHRVFLITMAAEVRYGALSQTELDKLVRGEAPASAASVSPQPGGQAAGLGAAAPEPEPGPALLADYAGTAATRAAAGDGR